MTQCHVCERVRTFPFPLPPALIGRFQAGRVNISAPRKTAQIEERLNGLVKLLQASGGIPSLAGDLVINPGNDPAARSQTLFNSHTPSPASHEDCVSQKESSPFTKTSALDSGPIWIPETYNCHGPPHCICRPTPGQAPSPIDSDETLLGIYQEELTQAYPFVIIPKGVTSTDLQATRPFLMSCIRMVASFRSMKFMQGQMYRLMRHVAEHMLIQSERSLDLLSGIVVILGWHHYHCFLHAQLHNLVSLAMTLTAELGLKRSPSWQERTKLMVINLGGVRERTNEEKRLLLAVWYLSSWYVRQPLNTPILCPREKLIMVVVCQRAFNNSIP